MTPGLINKSYSDQSLKQVPGLKKLKEFQKFIKNNFEYVGENFTYEARSIHYNSKKKTKGIYGNASKNEIKELKEEGIEMEEIPWVEDKRN